MEAILRREVILNKQICRACAVGLTVTCIALGAFVRVPLPFTPVPLTLQTFFILLSAALLDRRLMLISQSGYILLGILGLPVFTGAGSGLVYLLSPTAGYLFGFILASLFIGVSLEEPGKGLPLPAVFCIASAIILLTGSLWLKVILGISLTQALLMGFAPFVLGDCLKALAAAGVYLGLRKRVKAIL